VARRINGLSPWPGCRVQLIENEVAVAKLTLVRGRSLQSTVAGVPGTIATDGLIAAGDENAVEILEVQPEGKRPMPLQDFRNGRPWHQGMRVESIA
jgi:methionyl-tRNA formyltransferase